MIAVVRRTVVLAAVATALVALTAPSARAQASPLRFGAQAGLALPMGDFGDVAGLGLHLGGHMNLPLDGPLALRFDADYGRYAGEGGPGVDNVSLLGGVANLVYRIETASELKPYLLGGLGLYRSRIEGTGGGATTASDLAFAVGVGYDFRLGSADLFTELRVVSIQTDGRALNTLPIVIGMRF